MRLSKLIPLVSTILVFTSLCLAQAPTATPDPEKEKAQKEADERVMQILDQVVSDAALLRLPQNKAIVFAMAGDLYWKFDEKKSRDLFRSAAGEILLYQADREREKPDIAVEGYMEIADPSDPRRQVLPLLARHDAEMALELLIQTRPAALVAAMQKASAPDARTDQGDFMETMRVRQELNLEQQFALQAANENPDRAVRLIKESLTKGVSSNVIQLLQQLHKKDEKKASELAGEVVRKLVDLDLGRRQEELQVAINFLQSMARSGAAGETETKSKTFRFTDAQAKELANKLVNTFMAPVNSVGITTALSRAMPSLEKIVPDKVGLLKQRMSENQKNLPSEFRNMERMQKLWDPNSTPEQILAEVPKLQSEMERSSAYQAVSGKIALIDDEARAKKLIDQIGDEKARTRAFEQFELAKINRTAASGKLEDARKMIGSLTNKRMQIQRYVALAQQFHKKGAEADVEAAKALMKQARALINETPEDEDELNDLMEVVGGYATVEPDVAFRLFEPMVDQINDIVHASAILSKYNKRNRSFKKGELVLRANNSPSDGILLFRYFKQIQLLGKADLARTGSLADRFQRGDARTVVKLVALQGNLADEKKPPAQLPSSDFVIFPGQ